MRTVPCRCHRHRAAVRPAPRPRHGSLRAAVARRLAGPGHAGRQADRSACPHIRAGRAVARAGQHADHASAVRGSRSPHHGWLLCDCRAQRRRRRGPPHRRDHPWQRSRKPRASSQPRYWPRSPHTVCSRLAGTARCSSDARGRPSVRGQTKTPQHRCPGAPPLAACAKRAPAKVLRCRGGVSGRRFQGRAVVQASAISHSRVLSKEDPCPGWTTVTGRSRSRAMVAT